MFGTLHSMLASGSTIPDLGVDVPGFITALGTKLGTAAAAAIGVTIGLIAAFKGLQMVRRVSA